MIVPNLDNRCESDIINQIRKLSKQFVPEWNFSEKNPDFGVIFSKVFARMFLDTITRYNKMPYNHYAEFLNVIGANSYPPVPSTGMVSIKFFNQSGGIIAYQNAKGSETCLIKKGEILYAVAVGQGMGRFLYRTTEPMLAMFNEVEKAFVTCGEKNIAYEAYDIENKENDFRIFNFLKEDGRKKSYIYFKQDELFNFNENKEVMLVFKDNTSNEKQKFLVDLFSNPDSVEWEYFSEGKWKKFEKIERYEDEGIVLKPATCSERFKFVLRERQPFEPVIIDATKAANPDPYLIRANVKNVPKQGINFNAALSFSKETELEPEALRCGMNEVALTEIYPFQERFNIYDNFTITSPAFSKKNADIEIEIDYKFIKIEPDAVYNIANNPIYRNFMDKMDFEEPPPPETEIREVTWEYWNGKSWVRLFKGHEFEDAFNVSSKKDEPVIVKFKCPEDLQVEYTYGAAIRVRPTKFKNLNAVGAAYISPFINSIKIRYNYENSPQLIRTVFVEDDSKKRQIDFDGNTVQNILNRVLEDEPMTYFCINRPMNKSLIKMFFEIDNVREDLPGVIWQYAAKGKGGSVVWKPLDVIDLTSNFQHSGIVTIMGEHNDFAKTECFGKEGYFFRIVSKDKEYLKKNKIHMFPKILNVLYNTVGIEQIETVTDESFIVQRGEKNKEYKLLRDGALNIEVYVNEFEKVTSEEQEMLISCKDNKPVYDEKGHLSELWVKWNSVTNIKTAGPNDRVYEIDYLNGKIRFGDGRFGRIPSPQQGYNIRVSYQVSDGNIANVDAEGIMGFYALALAAEKATNLSPMVGGIAKETEDECKERVMKQIPGVGRIVSLKDFEDQVKCFCRDVDRVKCLPHINRMSQKDYGLISIAVVPKSNFQDQNYFLAVERNIRRFLKDKVSLNLLGGSKISIFEANYVMISVNLEAIIESYDYYQQVYQNLNQKIETFLNPTNGNFDGGGWEIGSIPSKEAINNCIRDIPNLSYIKNINVFYKVKDEVLGETYIDEESLDGQKFIVPLFDEAAIDISVYR